MFKGTGSDDDIYIIASILLEQKGKDFTDTIINQYRHVYKDMNTTNTSSLISYIARMLLDSRLMDLTEGQICEQISEHFTDRQIKIIINKYNGLILTKTETEYYSRTIKPRLKKLKALT
jgi:hypothetical protein